LDPCAGEGTALAEFTAGTTARTYGIELDKTRAAEASTVLDRVLVSPIEDCRVGHKSFSLIWLNPPYDWEHGEEDEKCERKELTFLKRSVPWLCPGGILVYIIPESAWIEPIRRLLAYHFTNIDVCRFPEPEYQQFRQIVVIATRKDAPSADTMPYLRYFPESSQQAAPVHVPVSNPIVKLFQSTHMEAEEMARLVENSPGWKMFLAKSRKSGLKATCEGKRPPLPLHSGHLSLMLAAGVLDGIVGHGEDSHVVKGKVTKGQSVKVHETVDAETGNVTNTTVYTDQYVVSVKLLDRSGQIREIA